MLEIVEKKLEGAENQRKDKAGQDSCMRGGSGGSGGSGEIWTALQTVLISESTPDLADSDIRVQGTALTTIGTR